MARVRERRIFWELNPEIHTHANVYAGDAGDGGFLAMADAGGMQPLARIPATEPQELKLGAGALPDGTYQFAVVAENADTGKFADPYQHEAWVSVPLDLSPLAPAFGGGFELL